MRIFLKSLIAAICAVAFSVSGALAESGAWRVVEISGAVRTTQAMAGVQMISTGETLGAGSVVSTGMDGRAVLSNGLQQIVVGPNSRMALPTEEEKGMTRIVQDLGTLLFKVDKQEKQHFRVETPIIAAVVKGTTFTVTAGASGHSVHVAEGAVEVSALSGGATQMVTAGMTARVSKANPRAIEMSAGGADRSEDTDASERGGSEFETKETKEAGLVVPVEIGADALDFSNLTDGLVQPFETGMGNDVSSAARGNGGGAAAVQQVRMNAVGDSGRTNNGVGSANADAGANAGAGNANANAGANAGGGNANANAGAGNANANAGANAGAGNANANAGADNANANAGANAGAGNANANAGVNAGVNAGNGSANVNAGATAGGANGNGGVNAGVNVGGVGVNAGAGENGVNAGVKIGGKGVNLGTN